MRIRKAAKKDIRALVRLYSHLPQLRDFKKQLFRGNYFSAYIGKTGMIALVATEDDKIIGGLNAEFADSARYAFLNNLVVKKEYQGKGVGTKLLHAIEKIAKKRGNRTLILAVYEWNKPMHKLMKHEEYEKYGKTVVYSKKL